MDRKNCEIVANKDVRTRRPIVRRISQRLSAIVSSECLSMRETDHQIGDRSHRCRQWQTQPIDVLLIPNQTQQTNSSMASADSQQSSARVLSHQNSNLLLIINY